MTEGPYRIEFCRAVAALRGVSPFYRELALHSANYWTNEEFVNEMMRAEFPPDVPADTTAVQTMPNLKVVK